MIYVYSFFGRCPSGVPNTVEHAYIANFSKSMLYSYVALLQGKLYNIYIRTYVIIQITNQLVNPTVFLLYYFAPMHT